MKTCIPVKSNRKPFEVTHWKSAPFYLMLNEKGVEWNLYSQLTLQSKISQSSLREMLQEEGIGSILCTSIPAMTRKLFSDCGVEVFYSSEEEAELAFKRWNSGKEEYTPEDFEFRLGCSGSCTSCESDSCS